METEFDKAYQTKLLATFYLDDKFFCSSRPFVKSEFFSSLILQKIFTFLETYYDQYKAVPSLDALHHSINNDRDYVWIPEERPLLDQFDGILNGTVNLPEQNWIKDAFRDFAKKKSV